MSYEKLRLIKWDLENVSYGNDEHQNFDIKIPNVKAAHAIVYIHGGAFFQGNKMEYPSFLANYAEKNIVASIDYRLVEENNSIQMGDIISDVKKAIEKIEEIANSKSTAIKDFILVGHSAGGQIALLYGYKYKEKIGAIVSLAGPTDFTDDIGWSSMSMWGENLESRLLFLSGLGSRLAGYPIIITQENWTKQANYSEFEKYIKDISPINYVLNNAVLPPTLLIHARSDNQVPYSNAERIKTALDCTSVPHKLITPAGSADSHMLGGELYLENTPFFFNNQSWLNEAKEWIEPYLD